MNKDQLIIFSVLLGIFAMWGVALLFFAALIKAALMVLFA